MNPCPDGFWGDTSSRTCKPCYESASSPFTCKTCTAGSSSSCTSCNEGTFLYGGQCLDPCPDGYWADESTQICQPCYNNPSGSAQQACATCSGPEGTNCLTCFTSTYHFSVDMSCLSTCPPGYYADDFPYPNNRCGQCYQNNPSISLDGTCATCSGPDSNQCLTCNGSWYLDSTTGKCVDSCPTGYVAVSSTINICQQCYQYNPTISFDGTCVTCDGPNSNHCLTCANFWYLDSTTGRCVSVCPDGYFGVSSTHTCQQCYQAPSPSSAYQSCAKCSAGTNKDCTACSSGAFLFQDDQTCLSICPDGYWGDTTTNTCQPCYSSTAGPNFGCATCPGGGADNNCTSCYSGSFLYLSRCIRTCPSDYFGDTSTNECVPCYNGTSSPFACKTCLGQNSSDCTSCYSANYLYPSSQGECLSECPSRYWRDNSTNKCQQCSEDLSSISECAVAIEYKVVASNLQSAAMGSTSGITAVAASFQNSNSASGIFGVNLFLYVSVIESIANMQYLNINHSQIASDSYAGLSKSFIPNWISNRSNSIDENLLVFKYGIFEKKQVSALYLDNYGGLLTETFIYAGLCLLGIPLVLKLKTPDKLPSSILGKMYALVFGILLSNLFGHIQSQILFSVLQILKTDLFIDTYPKVSYFMACVTIYVVMLLLLLSYCKLRAIFAFKEKQKKEASNPNLEVGLRHNKLEDSAKLLWTEKQYEMIFRNLKDDRKNAFFFFYWVILYNTIFIILILSLQSIPVLQCLSIAILTIGLLIFSAVLKPMKGKSAAILFFFNYICIAFIAIINLVLAIRDALDSQTIDNDRVGWVIFITISLNSGVNLLASICELFYVMYLSAKIIKAWCLKSGDKVKEETVSKKRGFEQNKTAHKTNPSALSAESNKQSSMVLEKEGWQRTLQMNFFKYSKFKILQRLQNREFALQNDGSGISESKPKEKASSKIDLGNRETFQEANYAIDLNTSSFNATRPEMLEVHIPSLVDPDLNFNTRKNTRLRRYRKARI